MNHADSTTAIAHKILRLQAGRLDVLRDAANATGGPSLADAARRIERIDGRIDGLTDALEILLGVEAVTASHLADLTV